MLDYRFTEDIRETYPGLLGRRFSEKEVRIVYDRIIDKNEYPEFEDWLRDMIRSGLIIRTQD